MRSKSLISFSIDPAHHLIRIEIPEEATLSELEKFQLELFLSPKLKTDYNILMVMNPNPIYKDVFDVLGIVKYASRLSHYCKDSKWAIIVDDKPSEIAFEMMGSFLDNQNVEMKIFNDEDEGEQWLINGVHAINNSEFALIST